MARRTKSAAKKPTRKSTTKRAPKKKTLAKKRAVSKKRSATKKTGTRKVAVKKRVAVKSAKKTKTAPKKRATIKKSVKKAVRKGPAKKRVGVKKTSKKAARKVASKRSPTKLTSATPERPAEAISADVEQHADNVKDNHTSIQTDGITELGKVALGAAAFVAFVAAALTWVPA